MADAPTMPSRSTSATSTSRSPPTAATCTPCAASRSRCDAGEVLAIVGESGSGKTVTARTILGLLPETATHRRRGRRSDGDDDVVGARARSELREVRGTRGRDGLPGAVDRAQPGLHGRLADRRGPARARQVHASRGAGARAIEMLGKVGIPDPETRVDDYPHQFSGGQKQRIVIAMALALDPTVIIADEPTTALDVTVQAEILELLRACRDEFGTAIVLITHNMGVVADLADRVAVMYHGEIVETAPVARAVRDARSTSTRSELLAAVPRARDRRPAARRVGRRPPRTPVVVARRPRASSTPGASGAPAFRAVDGVELHDRARRGARPGRRDRLGQDHDRPRHRRPDPGRRRLAEGARHRDARRARSASSGRCASELGFVFQDPATSFNPLLTIAQCVAEPLIVHGVARDAGAPRGRRSTSCSRPCSCPTAFGDRYPHELSRRSAPARILARALALDPKLLIADEPTSALDVSVQARVLELFARAAGASSASRPCSSRHDLAVVDLLAHRSSCCTTARSPRRDRRRRCWATRRTPTRSACSRRCRCPIPSSRPPAAPCGRRPAKTGSDRRGGQGLISPKSHSKTPK